jgi:hypothetical protein
MRNCISFIVGIVLCLYLLPFDALGASITPDVGQNAVWDSSFYPSRTRTSAWQRQGVFRPVLFTSRLFSARLPKHSQAPSRYFASAVKAGQFASLLRTVTQALDTWPMTFNSLVQITPVLLC